MSRRGLLAMAGTVWLVALAALTLSPQAPTRPTANVPQLSLCLICGDRGTADALLNVMLFVPLGLLLGASRRSVVQVLGVGLVLSSSIELAQHFIPGRYSNLGDVLSNTSGAGVGALLWNVRARLLPGVARHAAWLRNLAVIVAPLLVFGFGWLMEPEWPAEPYWGQWTPDLAFMEHYDGSVVSARLDSIPLPSYRFPPRQHPRRMLTGDWSMDATVIKGTPPHSLAPIVNIYDGRQREVTLLGALGEDLVYRERSRARRFRLDQPDLRLHGVMAHAAVGDTVRLSVERRGPSRCLSFDALRGCPGFTPGRAWALLVYPEGSPRWVRRTLDALCTFVLLFPMGFWSERRKGVAAAGLVTGLLIGVAVAMTRLVAPPWTEVAGAAAGLLAGHEVRLWVAADVRLTSAHRRDGGGSDPDSVRVG